MTVDNNTLSGTDQEENKPKKTKEEHILDFIKAIKELEELQNPFKEAKSDLKKLYKENNWLSKEDQTSILRSYRLLKEEQDIEEIYKHFDLLKRKKVLDLKE